MTGTTRPAPAGLARAVIAPGGDPTKRPILRVALCQIASPDDEPKTERIARVQALLAHLKDADLVVLPELWSTGYAHFDRYRSEAEKGDGPTISMCRNMARDKGFYLAAGTYLELTAGDRCRNTSVLIGPDGEVLHRFSKVHLFGYRSREVDILTPGTALPVLRLPFANYAATTCYDLRFPGLWDQMGRRGAELVVVPAAWPSARIDHWRALTTARAIESQLFLLACNAARVARGKGSGGGAGGGRSRIVSPVGELLAEAGEGEETVWADLDLRQLDAWRDEFPVLHDRLADYSGLTE
jgi:predicted amidohydrolase